MTPTTTAQLTAPPATPGRSAGFTLVEILVAIAIIAILSAIALPYYNGYVDRAKITISIRTMGTVRVAMDDYLSNYGNYPPAIDMTTGGDGLGGVVLPPALLADFKKDLFSFESYVATATEYTLKARAIDSNHTLLTLNPAEVITRGP